MDGLDGSGKDAHSNRIRVALERDGTHVVVRGHPSGGLFGRLSKSAVQKSGTAAIVAAAVFYAIDVLASVRRYARTRDGTVIFVRYLFGTAYLPHWLARFAYRFFRNLLPFPALPLFLDIEPYIAIQRIERRDHAREAFETEDRLSKIRSVALELARDEWVIIDNSEEGEEPFAQVQRILIERGFVSGWHG